MAQNQAPSLVGRQVGPYKIHSLLGVGGMGEVYRAKDTRLGREVAVKMLPTVFAADADRLSRFEQEARAAGRLNHTNILALYDVGSCDGSPYIVSELLDGATLRDQMGGNALTQRKAIDYALQIARGLAAAHGKGIIHRDLKPENVFITKDGRVKILDFGLAKLTHPVTYSGDSIDVSTAPTATAPGVLMGTVGYMSPEQVRGQVVDHRSDIFSFGAVMYEMVSGRRAFQGKSLVEMMSAILKEEPPELPPDRRISPSLERVVRHCLEKSPEQRFQSAGDIAFDLEGLSGSTPATPAVGPGRSKHRERLAWTLAGTFLAALLAMLPFVVDYLRRTPAEPRALKLSVLPPENATLGRSIAVSPDGRRLAFVATANGRTLLWVRPLDSLTAQALAGTEGASDPFWSPDSRLIGFFAQGKLKKIDISGGLAVALCDAADARGGTWSREGVIVFAPSLQDVLYRVSASGGRATPVTALDGSAQENSHRWPHFLPDGRHFVYFVRSAQRAWQGFYLGSLDSKDKKQLLNASGSAAYAAGHLLFVRDGALVAQPFDPIRLQMKGEPLLVAKEVEHRQGFFSEFSVSDGGVLAYRRVGVRATRLIWLDRMGKELGLTGAPPNYGLSGLSPDGKRVAGNLLDETGAGDIWLLDLSRGITSRLTSDPAYDWVSIWSPDGSRIVFSSNRRGPMDLYLKELSGKGHEEVLLESNRLKVPADWSRDGRFILYEDVDLNSANYDLWVLPLSGDRRPMPFLQTEFHERQGQFSPNGRWIAYVSNQSGKYEIYVQSFPGPGGRTQVSTDGGTEPRWRRDGKELFYIAADSKLMVVQVKGESTFEASVPNVLFVAPPPAGPGSRRVSTYSATADGQRFLFNSPVEGSSPTPITVVFNWTAELPRN